MTQIPASLAVSIRLFCFLLTGLLFLRSCAADLEYGLDEDIIVEEVAPAWTGSFASGLNGTSGNSQSLDVNMTLNLNRVTDLKTTEILANYFYGSNATTTVTDRAFAQFRHERKCTTEKWSWYYQNALEWDQFKAFNYRIAMHSGMTYQVFNDDDASFKLRMGAGASKEVGSANEDWSPELQFGGDWDRKLTDTLKIFAKLDYYPNVSDFGDFRFNTNAGLDFLVDAPRNINFRMFALDRYDSTPPPGNNENDIDYGMALVIGF
jgi:putative salt-induced outer membrane protein YdiY